MGNDEITLKPGWLIRQLTEARETVASIPKWMRMSQIYQSKDGKIVIEFKPVAGGGFRCQNCECFVEVVPHYCPSCALQTTNPEDTVDAG
jgi:lipopolysaccharide biosynthesis regulator YciM